MADKPILALSLEVAQGIFRHGAETYPHECCGALLGRDLDAAEVSSANTAASPSREVTALHPLVNRRDDSPRNRFSVTSEDVLEAEKSARAKGVDVVGWYHSHPDHPAAPSQYDQDHAWPWYSYVIVSVTNGTPGKIASWRLTDDRSQFTSEPLEIRESAKA